MNITVSRTNHHITSWARFAVIQLNTRFTCKIAVAVNDDLLTKLENREINARHHPGICNLKHVALPGNISRALKRVVGDHPIKTLVRDSKKFDQYLKSRHPPPERENLQQKVDEIAEEIDAKMLPENPELLDEDQANKIRKSREQAVRKVLKQRTYAWKPITYDSYAALVYAIGRSAHEYGVLMKILKELEERDATFKPRSYFDFGSGVGSGMWAASTLWINSIFEYYNVDSSREMQDLSELILREGQENQQPFLKNVYYRQFLPSIETKFDLVVSAFSLFELTNAQSRKEVMLNLWRKCNGYLVIVEEGTRKGSELINEIREYLLSQTDDNLKGHVFAPCPHDNACPRLSAAEDNTPCNFEVSYAPLKIGEVQSDRMTARFSYVVLKKGCSEDNTREWPRLVRPTMIRSKHIICKLCTEKGNLQEIIFTQSKHGKPAYRCAKASRWGDRLPIKVGERYDKIKITDEIERE